MATGFVDRAHYRELLDRVAAAEDTRPPAIPGMVLALSDASKVPRLTNVDADEWRSLPQAWRSEVTNHRRGCWQMDAHSPRAGGELVWAPTPVEERLSPDAFSGGLTANIPSALPGNRCPGLPAKGPPYLLVPRGAGRP
jgi:hypothetical protein